MSCSYMLSFRTSNGLYTKLITIEAYTYIISYHKMFYFRIKHTDAFVLNL